MYLKCFRSVVNFTNVLRNTGARQTYIRKQSYSSAGCKKGILERLAEGPVVGDGSMCMTLEKRGYCRAGLWTPEAVLKYPEAVEQLLREYLRAGADVLQTPCFYSSDGKLEGTGSSYTTADLNKAACDIAHKVAGEGDALVCGGISPVNSYFQGKAESIVRGEFENQLQIYIDNNVDFVLAEFFGHVEELEICVDVCSRINKPVACTMRIGPTGDLHGVSVEECAVRMARSGAQIIGTNCLYDVNTTLVVMDRIKKALQKEGLSPYLMSQPLGWMCPEVEDSKAGYLALPDTPLSLDSRNLTRFEVHKFTRSAYELGVHYIGGCCGMEPHHIRAISQELAPERKRTPPVEDMHKPFGGDLNVSLLNNVRSKYNNKEFWMDLKPASGRPGNPTTQPLEDAHFDEN